MVMKTFFLDFTFLLLQQIFEMLPTQKLLRYLPQRDQNTPSGI